MAIVYRITCNTTGRLYFGWTTHSLKERFSKHRRNCRRGYHIARCIQKYGAENFTAERLFKFETNDEAIAKEIELIALWKTNIVRYPDGNGMNMTDGGEGTEGFRHSSETKEIIKETSTGRKRSEKTQALINKLIEERGSYWNQGRKSSLETRKKQSESLKKAYATGIRQPRHDTHSKATKLKMSAAHKGKRFSEETKKRMSETRRGKRMPEEVRQKLRLANVGKKQSPETVERRVSKIRGKKLRKRTPEEKAKVREHFRNYFKTHPHPLLGKKMSAESRAKMRASRLAFLVTQREKADD